MGERTLASPLPAGTYCWIAGEADVTRAAHGALVEELDVPSALVHSRGYWKLGAAGHQEPHTD